MYDIPFNGEVPYILICTLLFAFHDATHTLPRANVGSPAMEFGLAVWTAIGRQVLPLC